MDRLWPGQRRPSEAACLTHVLIGRSPVVPPIEHRVDLVNDTLGGELLHELIAPEIIRIVRLRAQRTRRRHSQILPNCDDLHRRYGRPEGCQCAAIVADRLPTFFKSNTNGAQIRQTAAKNRKLCT